MSSAARQPADPGILSLLGLARRVSGALLEDGDLHAAVGAILAGGGEHLGADRALLGRLRGRRPALFVTHRWEAGEESARHGTEEKHEEGVGGSWLAPLEAGASLALTGVDDLAALPPAVWDCFGEDASAVLVLPLRVRGELQSFFAFVRVDRGEPWSAEERAHPELLVDILARAIERRVLDRERAAMARDLEAAVERERSANRHKSEFVARMSHELRTPLNAILGYSELLLRSAGDPETRQGWTGSLRKSAEHLLGLVDEVLDLSRIEEGHLDVRIRATELAPLLGEVESIMRVRAEAKLLELEFEAGGPLPLELETDPTRVRQILVNLVGNAVKYTDTGSVLVRSSVVKAEEGRDVLRIEVSDTGPGIPPGMSERIFEPFTQIEGREAEEGGVGLGLVICRRLARLLGGEVGVESEPGRGSRFWLALPIEVPAGSRKAAARSPEEEPFPSFADRRFLVVDDNPQNREVLTFLLRETGADVECEAGGEAGVERALHAWRAGRPHDLVLMDVHMPGMDGHAATEALREQGYEAPIVALTASVTEEERLRADAAGSSDFVTKPIVPARLFEVVKRHLGETSDTGTTPASMLSTPEFRDLVRRYVDSFQELRVALETQFREGRLADLRTHVHRLRGTAGNYGFPGITRAAGECEDAIRAGECLGVVGARLERLLGLLLQARAA